ncbi:DapH/DapD/GlmU-related protein [Clostridium butyricum]|uniref:DapH/DapD/GlmU-related protein n=1 Tax=Clostridium butyricum TaxID=1492 RepID=UPI00051BE5FD|nr:DapH/DapD/GlmU-related protein [Clostridium butyricum]
MGKIKKLYKFLLRGYKADSEMYIKYLKKIGVQIGENVHFHDPVTNFVDTNKPFMISIGNNVEITRGVVILAHGYDWAVLKQLTGKVYGSAGKVVIGNNVFIGMNSIILKNITIGNNVIIGAGSVVTEDIPDNSVVAGAPAKVINDILSYEKKRAFEQESEAKAFLKEYVNRYNTIPSKADMCEFIELFENVDSDKELIKEHKDILALTGNYDDSLKRFIDTKKTYSSYEEFVDITMNLKKNS